MLYRILLLIIGIELLALGVKISDERTMLFVFAAVAHAFVLIDVRQPGTIERLLKNE